MDSPLILQQSAEDTVVSAISAMWWLPATQSKSHCFRITYTTRTLHMNWGESQVHTRSVAPWWNMTINVSSGLWPQTKGRTLCILTPWFPVNPISGLAVRPCKTNKINYSSEKSVKYIIIKCVYINNYILITLFIYHIYTYTAIKYNIHILLFYADGGWFWNYKMGIITRYVLCILSWQALAFPLLKAESKFTRCSQILQEGIKHQ